MFVDCVAIVSLVGVVGTGFFSAAFGLGMPLLLLAGLIDGPSGGRLAALNQTAARVKGPAEGSRELSHRSAA